MSTLKFKTNINCSGCIASVTSHLNKENGIKKWEVDTANPEKVLTVDIDDNATDGNRIKQTVEKAGFKISEIG